MAHDPRPTLSPPPGDLPVGIIAQPYRDAIHDRTEIRPQLDVMQAIGVVGICWHGFPTEDPAWLDPLARDTRAWGFLCGASEGLDTSLRTGAQKGESLGRLAVEHHADFIGLDGESHFDPAAAEPEARDLCATFRAHAPTVPAFSQPWPQPSAHPHYPYITMNLATQASADQEYGKPWKKYFGAKRYEILLPKWKAEWDALEKNVLIPAGAQRPRHVTLEAYDYFDVIPDAVHLVITRPTIVAWAEPWFDPSFVLLCRVRQFLQARSFLERDCSNGSDAILRFQRDYNLTAVTKIAEDNRAGLKETIPAMGLKL